MNTVDYIVVKLNQIGSFFYSIYLEVSGWGFPFNLSLDFWNSISLLFFNMASDFHNLAGWIGGMSDAIQTFLTSNEILDLLTQPIEWAETAYNWVVSAPSIVYDWFTQWTSSTFDSIIEFVNSAISNVNLVIGNIQSSFAVLQSDWYDFRDSILSSIPNLSDIQQLVNSAIELRFPFYNELSSLWSDISSFFDDPEKYIYEKLDSFFERFW